MVSIEESPSEREDVTRLALTGVVVNFDCACDMSAVVVTDIVRLKLAPTTGTDNWSDTPYTTLQGKFMTS